MDQTSAGRNPGARILTGESTLASLEVLERSGLFGAFEYDLMEQTLSCSAEMVRRHGLQPEAGQLTFDAVWERILPGDRERVTRAAVDGVATGRLSVVYRVQPPGEEVRWMQVIASLLRAENGTPVKWSGIVLDASPALVAETVEHESRDQAMELVESIAESFVALDRDFRFTYVNQRVVQRSGKSREELIGRSLWEMFPAAVASEFYEGYRRVAEERVRRSFLVSYVQPDGTHSWFEAHAYPTAEGIAALVRDVTELKGARDALEASEERFRRAQQAANVGAFEWDLGTNELTWAAKVPTFTEVSDSDDFAGYLQYVDEADRSAVLGTIQRILDGGQHSVEVRVHPPDGRSLWFYFRAEAVFDGEGKPRRVYGVAMDVTERKQAEAALRLSEKLAATGRLAATIAHEINNPLEAVTNLLFLARNSEDAGREARGYLAQAEAELQRVAAIVRQTLGFYRGTTGPANLDLTAMVRESLAMLERRFAGNGIRLVEAMEGVTVRANEGEVRQVVMNLIANALDAVERGGTVWVEATAAQGKARLEVRDDGKGISAGDMERLFEPFFTTKQGVGTGLGLWVSRELARKNGGGIEAASEGEGRGASFVLTLPLG